MLGLDLSKDAERFRLALAVMFLITMLVRPLAMATLTGEMEDKDGKTKAMPMYIVIMILGILSAGLFLYGGKVEALKGMQNKIALGLTFVAVLLYGLVMWGLKKANATAGVYLTAIFDLVGAASLFGVLLMIYLEPSAQEKLAAAPASFGHFYY